MGAGCECACRSDATVPLTDWVAVRGTVDHVTADDSQRRPLVELSEEDILAQLLPLLNGPGGANGGRHERVVVGPGDDAAVLHNPGDVILTTDTMVRGRDWRDDWSSARDVAAKLVVQNLADVAAMGGIPTGLLLTIAADPSIDLAWVLEFGAGIGEASRAAHTSVLGGDLSSAPSGTVVVSITATGTLAGLAPVLRSGARAGDLVAVCGTLGTSAAGLELLLAGEDPDQAGAVLIAAHRRPTSPLSEGPRAARAGATAMIDISDGLLRDAARIASASAVQLDLSESAILREAQALVPAVTDAVARECVLTGGEEHSLLACMPRRVHRELGSAWRVIGQVVKGSGVSIDGAVSAPRGWDHFLTE